jgi:hypothetical protein
VVEMNSAFEAKLAGPVRKTGGRDMIAVDIPRPRQLTRRGGDYELGFEHLLVAIVTRMQHHPVLAERDRLLIVVGRDVPDGENRHCSSTMMQVPSNMHFSRQEQCVSLPSRRFFMSLSADERDVG